MIQLPNLSRRSLLLTSTGAAVALVTPRLLSAGNEAPSAGSIELPPVDYALQVCSNRTLPPEMLLKSLQNAWKENHANDLAKVFDENGKLKTGAQPEAAVSFRKLWPQNRVLKVGFFGGTQQMRTKVQTHVEEWHKIVNVQFQFGTSGPFEIRIGFDPGAGSYSYVGTDNTLLPNNQPTMNFGWVTNSSNDIADRAVILHEFGHALGMIHEHQSPAGSISWNKPVVYDAMWRSARWSRQDVDQQILNRDDPTETKFTPFDPESIMMYHFPPEWTTNGFSAPENTRLSVKDIDFMGKQYPKNGGPPVSGPGGTPGQFCSDPDGRRAAALKEIRKLLDQIKSDIPQ